MGEDSQFGGGSEKRSSWHYLGSRSWYEKDGIFERLRLSDVSDNADDTTLMAESEKDLKSLLMKVKEESVKLA